jgi:hypothetical protein
LITVPAWASGSNQSTIANQGAEHYIFIRNLMKPVTDLTTGTITVRCVAGHQGSGVAATWTGLDVFYVKHL